MVSLSSSRRHYFIHCIVALWIFHFHKLIEGFTIHPTCHSSSSSSSSSIPNVKKEWRPNLQDRSKSIPSSSSSLLPLLLSADSYNDNTESRRDVLLSRTGEYFNIEKKIDAGTTSKIIEFGTTAFINTLLYDDGENHYDSLCEWLKNEKDIATSIWDKNKMSIVGTNIYRLQVMKLKFFSMELQPSVDMKMYTDYRQSTPTAGSTTTTTPVFTLESVGFEPNIKIGKGIGFQSSESIGLHIEVFGELYPNENGTGIAGKIAFQTTGKLLFPLTTLPQRVLKAAISTFENAILQFATKSFQKGAREEYNKYKASLESSRKEQEQQQRQKVLVLHDGQYEQQQQHEYHEQRPAQQHKPVHHEQPQNEKQENLSQGEKPKKKKKKVDYSFHFL